MTPARRPLPYRPVDHALGALWLVACCGALALAATAAAARLAAGAGLLAGWWAWHGPRLALDEVHMPAGERRC